MRNRARVYLAGLLALAVPCGAAVAQEVSRPKPAAVVPVAPDESVPVKVNKKPASVFDPLEMKGFSVALLLGEIQGAATPDNLPPGAAKALADVREFLPYKNYRLLDTQWIRCCAGQNVTGKLRGLEEQKYAFEVHIHGVAGSKFSSNFVLTDADLVPIISSNFSMEIGETVVIGTSSLKGEKALVVLLTAVPRSGTASAVKKGSSK